MYRVFASLYFPSLYLNLQIKQPEFLFPAADAPAAGAGFPPIK